MIRLTINQQTIEVKKGCTLLEASKQLGLSIPTLCHKEDLDKHTSCMVCVVEETQSGKLLPSCTALAEHGMTVQTDSESVFQARQSALNLLLSEHVGDCEAPCQLVCPAHMNIPLMLRQISANQLDDAIQTVKDRIAIPAVLGRICPAPCEKGCRRKQVDEPVSICLLKRFAADMDLSSDKPYLPEIKKRSGKHVVIVGAGPAGLSSAYYLLIQGHQCTMIDTCKAPGGKLRTELSEALLPKSILDSEIAIIEKLGLKFQAKKILGKDVTLRKLQNKYDAVVLTLGEIDEQGVRALGLESSERGIKIHPKTHMTSLSGVFSGGNATHPGKLAVRSAGHGWAIAQSVHQFLNGSE
ncbi:2Fe-2S iron-sulfur cluster-binding protein, partial [bacterium]